ncbi:Phospholipid-transporting ATPase 3 [Diplonema papillatum]|nr:Phospholipid-transporting ATPase 3 [Diplonema papillatum]
MAAEVRDVVVLFSATQTYTHLHRYANCYFLVVATLQLLPGLSPTGQFTTIIPLSLVLFVTFCKDVFEDYRRHQRDAEVNSQTINVYRNNTWQMVLWRDISVGDLVEVARDISRGEFPADLLLLWSTEDDGLCHIETSNLDGETNLKLRKSHSENAQTQHPPFSRSDPSTFQGNIFCQPPNKDLYNFEGRLIRGDRPEDTSAIGIDSILLRGAKLGGSTKKVVGLVVYTGSHSKLMMNQQATRHKASSLESMTNRQIIFIFIFDIILCSTCAAGLGVSTNVSMDHWYLAAEDLNPVWTAVTGVATFIILFNNLIPISLYVSMEMVKIVQAQLIGSDLEMYHGATDTPANARTSSLNEELGQIQYIFSDKTGTLTCNIMDFLKFSVGEMSYGTGTTEIGRAAALREGRALRDDRPPGIKLEKGFFFYDDRVSDVHGQSREWRWMHQPNRGQLEHFFKILAVCHTVVTEEETDESGQPVLTYTAASPDENCLVCGMRYLGIKFIGRDATHVSIEVAQANGKPTVEKWRLYEVIEFNSDRKRMSIITRDPMGRLYLLTKGADTVIYDRLRRPVSREEESTNRVTKTTLERFGADGLRTLCVAQVQLEEAQYAEWAPLYKAATESVGDRQKKVDAAAELIERNLELVGTTAIEDKLQDGVPQAIELLRTAGLNVWVLTGDKQETAINIGYACALLHSSMEVFKFDENAPRESIGGKIREFMHDAQRSKARNPNIDVGVVIQGATLVDVTSETAPLENKENFLKLTEHCKAVICCRVTPGQKAEIVRLVKDGLGQVTLSIGDGANDVAMITEAHVGIGISGLEGMQAARAADYAIGQFRFLVRLLLVHGRWSYRRVSKVILYSFYKNILLYLTQFWFCFCNFFTGQSLYDRWALASFNLAFTGILLLTPRITLDPVIRFSALQPGSGKTAIKDHNSQAYDTTNRGAKLNTANQELRPDNQPRCQSAFRVP